MKLLKRIVAVLTVLFMLLSVVYAEETDSVSFLATKEGDNITIVEQEHVSTVDNSDLQVYVVRHSEDGTHLLYTGPLGGYDNGKWSDRDFSKVKFLVIFDWERPEDGGVYIFPVASEENPQTAVEEQTVTKGDEISVYQNSIVQTATQNAEVDISLLYNNAYSESVLLPGEELTAEFDIVNNNTESSIELSSIIGLYDESGRFVDMKVESISIEAGDTETLYNKIVVPVESTIVSAKIMVWESTNSLKPYTAPVVLTLSGVDFFGDDYLLAQTINGKNKASGKINNIDDVDVFAFTPQIDGLYYFETFSNIDTYASIYEEGNLTVALNSDDDSGADSNFRLSATLESDVTYYLYLNGRNEGEYTLNYGYSIGDIYGTVSPVKFYNDDTEYNSEIEAIVELETYHTNEFVASMHLKDWSESNNEYASYSMTGIHAGEYLVKIKRPGYLTHYQKISLEDNAIDLGSVTLIPGDVNGDDVVSLADWDLVNSLLGVEYEESTYMTSADINADKIINEADLNLINSNLNMNSNWYASNINIIFMDAQIYDNQLIVTGKASPNSKVHCIVFYDDYSIYEGETTCSNEGNYDFEIELNRNGSYSVLITSDNHAYEVTNTITY